MTAEPLDPTGEWESRIWTEHADAGAAPRHERGYVPLIDNRLRCKACEEVWPCAGAAPRAEGLDVERPAYDPEKDRQLFEAEVEDWYAAYDSLGAAEARTFEGRLALYNDFQKAYYDARNTRQREEQ